MSRVFPEMNFLEHFIEEYRRNECLWNIRSKSYHHQYKREEAYERLRQVVVRHFGEKAATREYVIKKIKNIRSVYKKELNKLRNSLGTHKVYIPRLWYFNLLQFLTNHDDLRQYMNVLTSNNVNADVVFKEESKQWEEDEQEDDRDDRDDEDTIKDNEKPTEDEPKTLTPIKISKLRSPASAENEYECPLSPSISLQECSRSNDDHLPSKKRKCCFESEEFTKLNEREDEFDVAGKHYAFKLRNLDPENRCIVEKLVSDVIFEARLGRLKSTTIVWTPKEDR